MANRETCQGEVVPANGLSLVGFITDHESALNHLRGNCVAGAKTDEQLITDWQKATSELGTPTPNAGHPNIQAVPAGHESYLAHPTVIQELASYPGATIQMVEIDPLLAFQLTIDLDRAAHHGGALSNPPTLGELLALCLPLEAPEEKLASSVQNNQSIVLLRSPSLNLRLKAAKVQIQTLPTAGIATVEFGVSSPFVHVTRYGSRCYVNNGLHRAYAARIAGASHIPCVFRDVSDPQGAGIRPDGSTFHLAQLGSDNPPTVAHFAHGKALPVALRIVSRLIQFSWAEYVVAEE
jgi:hypothetical protein